MLSRRRLGGLAFLALLGACARETKPGPTALDLDGNPVDPLAEVGDVTVLIFVTTTCPISNRYAPTLASLAADFPAARLVRVYPSRLDSPQDVRKHASDFELPGTALLDPQHALVRAGRAHVTPQAAVFVPAGGSSRLVYSGRIDDRAVDFGHFRPSATHRDLRDVLMRIGEGQVPDRLEETEAVGCYIADLR